MIEHRPTISVICNDPQAVDVCGSDPLRLAYRAEDPRQRNVRLGLPQFVRDVYRLPARILDLLEIAAYVYAADRFKDRGARDAVEYHSWARSFDFHIRVRDYEFWSQPSVQQQLRRALEFMTGDYRYAFTFYPGHSTPPASLFDQEDFERPTPDSEVLVLPFSGGLDSLAGAVDLLERTDGQVCLVSHQSQTGTVRTQNALANALRDSFAERVRHYSFQCNLTGARAREETQRTRSFLFFSIAFSVATAYQQNRFFIFENGMTSINFARRQDLFNARASRTTHPQTIFRLRQLFSSLAGDAVLLELPFLWHTKADVIRLLLNSSQSTLIQSAVSCTQAFQVAGNAPQCGECFQCIDRRLAAHAAWAEQLDHPGLYANDVANQSINRPDNRTTIVDYIRLARRFADWHVDRFHDEMLGDLSELIDYLPGSGAELSDIGRVWELCQQHAEEVKAGIQRMQAIYDDPYERLGEGSLLQLVSGREYLKPEVKRLVEKIQGILVPAISKMYRKNRRPNDENDLNAKIAGVLDGYELELRSEHPTASFACAKVQPDHIVREASLLIEAKYIRNGTTPSKANEGIASDLTKYPGNFHVLFLVFDPGGSISDDRVFKSDIESKGRCTVCIIR